jgi:CBS domain-containing protein
MPTEEQALGAIDDACDEAALHRGVQQATAALAADFRAQTPVSELGTRLGDMHRHAVATAVRLVPGTAALLWTWFVSGSVARGEPAPGSDVESLLAIDDDVDDEGKEFMLARAADVHGLLERCGIGGDANGVLASRPRFCRRMRSWAEGVGKWTADPRHDRGVVMTGLMSDSTAVLGTLDVPEHAFRTLTLAAFGDSPPASQALLQDATALRAPFPSRLRAFATQSDSVDLKLAAIDPVVKIARWAALAAGSEEISTAKRIDAAATVGSLDTDDATSLQDCFTWLVRFRWRVRIGCFIDSRSASDVVSLSELAPQDRAALRSVAREIAGISRKLRYLSSFA